MIRIDCSRKKGLLIPSLSQTKAFPIVTRHDRKLIVSPEERCGLVPSTGYQNPVLTPMFSKCSFQKLVRAAKTVTYMQKRGIQSRPLAAGQRMLATMTKIASSPASARIMRHTVQWRAAGHVEARYHDALVFELLHGHRPVLCRLASPNDTSLTWTCRGLQCKN